MEIEYTYKGKILNTAVTLWHYYIYIYAPRVINNLLSAGIFFLLYPCLGTETYGNILFGFAIILFGVSIAEFPAFCYRYIKFARSCRAYEIPTRIKLNEEMLVIERGSDSGNTGLQSMSGYFIYRNRLFLLVGGKSLMCAINLKEIPNGMETARAIMVNSPVRRWKFLRFRNWCFTLILLILTVAIILLPAIA